MSTTRQSSKTTPDTKPERSRTKSTNKNVNSSPESRNKSSNKKVSQTKSSITTNLAHANMQQFSRLTPDEKELFEIARRATPKTPFEEKANAITPKSSVHSEKNKVSTNKDKVPSVAKSSRSSTNKAPPTKVTRKIPIEEKENEDDSETEIEVPFEKKVQDLMIPDPVTGFIRDSHGRLTPTSDLLDDGLVKQAGPTSSRNSSVNKNNENQSKKVVSMSKKVSPISHDKESNKSKERRIPPQEEISSRLDEIFEDSQYDIQIEVQRVGESNQDYVTSYSQEITEFKLNTNNENMPPPPVYEKNREVMEIESEPPAIIVTTATKTTVVEKIEVIPRRRTAFKTVVRADSLQEPPRRRLLTRNSDIVDKEPEVVNIEDDDDEEPKEKQPEIIEVDEPEEAQNLDDSAIRITVKDGGVNYEDDDEDDDVVEIVEVASKKKPDSSISEEDRMSEHREKQRNKLQKWREQQEMKSEENNSTSMHIENNTNASASAIATEEKVPEIENVPRIIVHSPSAVEIVDETGRMEIEEPKQLTEEAKANSQEGEREQRDQIEVLNRMGDPYRGELNTLMEIVEESASAEEGTQGHTLQDSITGSQNDEKNNRILTDDIMNEPAAAAVEQQEVQIEEKIIEVDESKPDNVEGEQKQDETVVIESIERVEEASQIPEDVESRVAGYFNTTQYVESQELTGLTFARRFIPREPFVEDDQPEPVEPQVEQREMQQEGEQSDEAKPGESLHNEGDLVELQDETVTREEKVPTEIEQEEEKEVVVAAPGMHQETDNSRENPSFQEQTEIMHDTVIMTQNFTVSVNDTVLNTQNLTVIQEEQAIPVAPETIKTQDHIEETQIQNQPEIMEVQGEADENEGKVMEQESNKMQEEILNENKNIQEQNEETQIKNQPEVQEKIVSEMKEAEENNGQGFGEIQQEEQQEIIPEIQEVQVQDDDVDKLNEVEIVSEKINVENQNEENVEEVNPDRMEEEVISEIKENQIQESDEVQRQSPVETQHQEEIAPEIHNKTIEIQTQNPLLQTYEEITSEMGDSQENAHEEMISEIQQQQKEMNNSIIYDSPQAQVHEELEILDSDKIQEEIMVENQDAQDPNKEIRQEEIIPEVQEVQVQGEETEIQKSPGIQEEVVPISVPEVNSLQDQNQPQIQEQIVPEIKESQVQETDKSDEIREEMTVEISKPQEEIINPEINDVRQSQEQGNDENERVDSDKMQEEIVVENRDIQGPSEEIHQEEIVPEVKDQQQDIAGSEQQRDTIVSEVTEVTNVQGQDGENIQVESERIQEEIIPEAKDVQEQSQKDIASIEQQQEEIADEATNVQVQDRENIQGNSERIQEEIVPEVRDIQGQDNDDTNNQNPVESQQYQEELVPEIQEVQDKTIEIQTQNPLLQSHQESQVQENQHDEIIPEIKDTQNEEIPHMSNSAEIQREEIAPERQNSDKMQEEMVVEAGVSPVINNNSEMEVIEIQTYENPATNTQRESLSGDSNEVYEQKEIVIIEEMRVDAVKASQPAIIITEIQVPDQAIEILDGEPVHEDDEEVQILSSPKEAIEIQGSEGGENQDVLTIESPKSRDKILVESSKKDPREDESEVEEIEGEAAAQEEMEILNEEEQKQPISVDESNDRFEQIIDEFEEQINKLDGLQEQKQVEVQENRVEIISETMEEYIINRANIEIKETYNITEDEIRQGYSNSAAKQLQKQQTEAHCKVDEDEFPEEEEEPYHDVDDDEDIFVVKQEHEHEQGTHHENQTSSNKKVPGLTSARREYSVYEDWRILESFAFYEKTNGTSGSKSLNTWNVLRDPLTNRKLLDGERTAESMKGRMLKTLYLLTDYDKKEIEDYISNHTKEEAMSAYCRFEYDRFTEKKKFKGIFNDHNFNTARLHRKTPYKKKTVPSGSIKLSSKKNTPKPSLEQHDYEEEEKYNRDRDEEDEIEDVINVEEEPKENIFNPSSFARIFAHQNSKSDASAEVFITEPNSMNYEVSFSQPFANNSRSNSNKKIFQTGTRYDDEVQIVTVSKPQPSITHLYQRPKEISIYETPKDDVVIISKSEAMQHQLKSSQGSGKSDRQRESKKRKDYRMESFPATTEPEEFTNCLKKVKTTKYFEEKSLLISDEFKVKISTEKFKPIETQKNIKVFVNVDQDPDHNFRQFVIQDSQTSEEYSSQNIIMDRLVQIAHQYKMRQEEVLHLFHAVSHDFDDLLLYLKTKNEFIPWEPSEDQDLLEGDPTALRYLLQLKGEDRINRRKEYLMGA